MILSYVLECTELKTHSNIKFSFSTKMLMFEINKRTVQNKILQVGKNTKN